MKHIKLGDLDVSRIGLGAMGMSAAYTGAGTDDAESIRTIHRALDLGVTFIDTAEMYGPVHQRGTRRPGRQGPPRRGRAGHQVRPLLARRRRPRHLDSSPANIRTAVEGSLRRLGTDRIDLYYQHRVDPSTPIEDTVGALAELVAEGKVRHIGLSEAGSPRSAAPTPCTRSPPCSRSTPCGPATPRQRCCRCCASWASASCPSRRWATASSPGRSAPPSSSTTATCARPTRASPARTSSATCSIADEVEAIAAEAGATPAQVALAWLLAQGDDIAPDPRHQAGLPGRGEHRRRRHRTDRRADRQAQPPHPGRRRAPRGSRHG